MRLWNGWGNENSEYSTELSAGEIAPKAVCNVHTDRIGSQRRTASVEELESQTGDCSGIVESVYHEFDSPYEMTRKMISGLKKGGRIVFVEYRKEDPKVAIKEVHKMSEAQVRKEMQVHPEMEWIETRKELPQQHIIVFRKRLKNRD